jgi:hypothetical protein
VSNAIAKPSFNSFQVMKIDGHKTESDVAPAWQDNAGDPI